MRKHCVGRVEIERLWGPAFPIRISLRTDHLQFGFRPRNDDGIFVQNMRGDAPVTSRPTVLCCLQNERVRRVRWSVTPLQTSAVKWKMWGDKSKTRQTFLLSSVPASPWPGEKGSLGVLIARLFRLSHGWLVIVCITSWIHSFACMAKSNSYHGEWCTFQQIPNAAMGKAEAMWSDGNWYV